MKKRVLSLLLVLVMAVGMLPVSAMAAEGEPAPAPGLSNNLKEPEVTYYSDSSIRALSIQITKDEASYTKDTLEIKWQSSNSGEEGSFSDAKKMVCSTSCSRAATNRISSRARPSITGQR